MNDDSTKYRAVCRSLRREVREKNVLYLGLPLRADPLQTAQKFCLLHAYRRWQTRNQRQGSDNNAS